MYCDSNYNLSTVLIRWRGWSRPVAPSIILPSTSGSRTVTFSRPWPATMTSSLFTTVRITTYIFIILIGKIPVRLNTKLTTCIRHNNRYIRGQFFLLRLLSKLGWKRYSLTEIKFIFTELWIRNDITFEYTAIYKTWWPTVCTVYYWGHCFVLGISSLYPELASWCGSGYPTSTLNSKFSTLMISFSSDDSDNNYRGFKIAYWAKTNGKGSPVVARLVCVCSRGPG